jgi:hypothetical protein
MHDTQRLVSLEIALAKREIKDMAIAGGIAAGLIAGGGLLALLAILIAVPSLVVALVPWHWQAALVWVAAYFVLGTTMVLIGKAGFKLRLPTRTIDSLKENKEWAIRQIRSNGK